MPKALTLKNVTVHYPNQPLSAAEKISFSVDQGTISMLIGPNGSGKTTVMRAILGLVPFEGSITVFGKPLAEARNQIGYVPQRFSFDYTFPLTVEEFLNFSLVGYKIPQSMRAQTIEETLQKVLATELKKRKLSTLSGGQLQRILLARALAHHPSLLLLDEPETGIDVAGEQSFYDLITNLSESEKLTALVASHELDVVYAYADQVVCINRKKFCAGVPKKVLTHEMFEQLYGHSLKFYGHGH